MRSILFFYIIQFVCNMMLCGKSHNQLTLREFILESPSPVDVAAKLSRILVSLSGKVICKSA